MDRKDRDHFLYSVSTEPGVDGKFTFRRVRDEQAVAPADEHLKDLEDLVGNWVAEEALNQDMPGIAQKGDRLPRQGGLSQMQSSAAAVAAGSSTTLPARS